VNEVFREATVNPVQCCVVSSTNSRLVSRWRLTTASEQGTTFGAVSGDRKQTTYAFVSWRVADDLPATSYKTVCQY